MLDAKRFFERRERTRIETPRRQRHAQFEGLSLVMQARAALQFDALRREAVLRQSRPRFAFEPVDDVLQLGGRDRPQQPLAGAREIILDLGIE